MNDFQKTPFPVKYRELWLPPGINGNATLPSSVRGGHALTLTGAKLGTTADGVHFSGSATSYAQIVAEAAFNNKPKLTFFMRFKFDQTFQTGVATQWVYEKLLVNEWVRIYFDTADGKLTFTQGDGAGGTLFTLKNATTVVWTAGTWYTVLCALSDVGPLQKIEVNGIVEANSAIAARNTPNGGNSIIGNQTAAGAAGFIGTISAILMDSTLVSGATDNDLVAGMPFATPVYWFLMDEGRGVTCTNRGSGGNNGTIQAANTWAFGQVEQPVLSLNGIGDYGQSSAGVSIAGALSTIWVGKMKTTGAGLSNAATLSQYIIDGANRIRHAWQTDSTLQTYFISAGSPGGGIPIAFNIHPVIDDYWVLINTAATNGNVTSYLNGTIAASGSGFVLLSGASARLQNLGADATPAKFDISKPLFVALIEGDLTAKQALAYSRWLRDQFNLPISM